MDSTSLVSIVMTCQRRAWAMRCLTIISATCAVLALCLWIGVDGVWRYAPILLLFGCAVVRPSAMTLIRRADKLLQTEGAIECAYDNRHRTHGIVVAQRSAATRTFAQMPLERLVPMPHPLWSVPFFALAIASFQGHSSVVETTEAPTTVESPMAVAQLKPIETAEDDAAAEQMTEKRSLKTREVALENIGQVSDEAPARETAQTGKRTGRSLAHQSGRRLIKLEQTVQAAVNRVPPASSNSATARSSLGTAPAGIETIAQPNRAYPQKYRDVIGAWFRRGGERN